MSIKKKDTTIYRLSFRINKGPRKDIIALKDICEKKKEILMKEHGDNIKFEKMVDACYNRR